MTCLCRTASLRIFVQSLADLRLTDSALARTGLKLAPIIPRAHHYLSRHPLSRQFSTASALRLPRHRWRRSSETPLSSIFEDLTGETLKHAKNDPPRTPALGATANDLKRAQREGSVLDLSPESIEDLAARFDRQPDVDPLTSPLHTGAEHYPEPVPDPAPFSGSNKLKRLKIIKPDKPRRDELHHTPPKEDWQIQKHALKEKFPEGWMPRKRLSPDALDGIRALHQQYPEAYTTQVLAQKFEVTPEAIRRILKSKWTPTADEEIKRQERWFKRGKQIWGHMAELGKKPPRKWRREGIVRAPHWNQKRGPRTEWPYQPHRPPPADEEGREGLEGPAEPEELEEPPESVQRKLSGTIL
ncbi:hypothetical protein F4778DRAFT_464780 [Xylariomycetidae sp. FL2044]|nr:hypothetical protein F4778DRAFT_464780 [Xylariomycetidae sp. FL2044]